MYTAHTYTQAKSRFRLLTNDLLTDVLALVRERWLAERGTDLSAYGEHMRDLIRPQALSRLLSNMNHLHWRVYGRDIAFMKVSI